MNNIAVKINAAKDNAVKNIAVNGAMKGALNSAVNKCADKSALKESTVKNGAEKDGTAEGRAAQAVDVLFRYCLALTRSVWDAEDLVQEACLRAMKVITGEQEHNNPIAFLIRTAKNIWIDELRKQSRAAQFRQQMQSAAIHHDEHYFETDDMITGMLLHLSPLQLTVFLLRDIFGYSAAEAGDLLRTTEGAVKSALHRARRAVERYKAGSAVTRAAETELDYAWVQAYLSAFRHDDPAALVYLTMLENQSVHTLEAVGMMNSRRFAAGRSADLPGYATQMQMKRVEAA